MNCCECYCRICEVDESYLWQVLIRRIGQRAQSELLDAAGCGRAQGNGFSDVGGIDHGRPHAWESGVVLPLLQLVDDALHGGVVLCVAGQLREARELHLERSENRQNDGAAWPVVVCLRVLAGAVSSDASDVLLTPTTCNAEMASCSACRKPCTGSRPLPRPCSAESRTSPR
jgi:hypothetical protein